MALLHVNTYSEILEQHISFDALIPNGGSAVSSEEEQLYPALYLLHGLSDDHTVWQRWSSLELQLGSLPLAVIMPTTLRGFYTDMKYGPKYFTFISEELPKICERLFHISPKREDRFAAGLSMGGYGAFKLGLRCPDRYGAVASLSGALDVVGSTECAFDYDTILHDFSLIFGEQGAAIGTKDDLFALAENITDDKEKLPKFFQWCGVSDKLYQENKCFNEKFGEKLGIEYHEGPGSHEWLYWDMHIKDVLEWLPVRGK